MYVASIPHCDACALTASTLRRARQATVLPLAEPIMGTDGRLITEVPVAPRQSIIVGIEAANQAPATREFNMGVLQT